MKNLFLSVSQGISVDTDSIIGIFDMDTSTMSPSTRSFLRASQSKNSLVSDVRDIPKSFVVTKDKTYLSQLASQTLGERTQKTFSQRNFL